MEAVRDRTSAPVRPSQPPHRSTLTEQMMATIKTLRDEGYMYIEQALSCDEQSQIQQAYALYTKGAATINSALQHARNIPPQNQIGPDWDATQQRVKKMEKSKQEIESRIEVLSKHKDVLKSKSDPPPSYAIASSTSLEDDLDAIMNDSEETSGSSIDSENAVELFNISDGVQMFYISPEGNVSAPSYPSSLGVYKFTDQSSEQQGASNAPDKPPAFLKVGNWVYPLSHGSSPALQSFWGAYVFPDLASGPGCAVGVIIPDSVSNDQKMAFENILNELTALRIEESVSDSIILPEIPHEEPVSEGKEQRSSEKIAHGIVTAAEWISWGLGKSAQKAGELMKYSSTKLKENLKPEADERKIDPRAQQGIYYTRKATSSAVKVSGYLVNKLGEATMALGQYVAPYVKEQGNKILPESWKKSKDGGRSKIDDVTEVAIGGLKGWATVYIALETAAKSLAKNLADETVHIVQHKYGGEAGQFTEHTLYSAGNVGVAAYNLNNLGVKAVAKRAAKDTGKALVTDCEKDTKLKIEQNKSQEGENKEVEISKTGAKMKMKEKQ